MRPKGHLHFGANFAKLLITIVVTLALRGHLRMKCWTGWRKYEIACSQLTPCCSIVGCSKGTWNYPMFHATIFKSNERHFKEDGLKHCMTLLRAVVLLR